jgi:FkbM family methyltransferase
MNSAASSRPPTDRRSLRGLARLTARRLGVEEQALSAYEAVLRAMESPTVRRNRRDDELVGLLAAAVLSSDSNCVDVGANEGQLLRMFTRLAPAGRHIAYEPLPSLAAELQRRFPRVDVRPVAVSDRGGRSEFVVDTRLPSRSSLRPISSRPDTTTIQVPVERLDDALPDGYVPHLVKIDVEGAEHLVLEGARKIIIRDRPVIVFEHQRSTAGCYGSGPKRMFDLLVGDLEMRIFDLEGTGPYSLADFRLAYERGTPWNFFAVPALRRGRDAHD